LTVQKTALGRFFVGVAGQPEQREFHVICDNVGSHETQCVADFFSAHRNVQMHFTPTNSSWLNQVENWFRAFSETS